MADATGAQAPQKPAKPWTWAVVGVVVLVVAIAIVSKLSQHSNEPDPLATYTTSAETQFSGFIDRFATFRVGRRVDEMLRGQPATFVAMPAGAPSPAVVPPLPQALQADEATLDSLVRSLPDQRAQAKVDQFTRAAPPDGMKDAHKLLAQGLASENTAIAEMGQFANGRQEPVLAKALADLGQADRDLVEGLRLAHETLRQAG